MSRKRPKRGHTKKSGSCPASDITQHPTSSAWDAKCTKRAATAFQQHHETIDRQDQVQIYEELVAEPADDAAPKCGDGAPAGRLTTSFLSICTKVKDNRILPHGFLPLALRSDIAAKLGADAALAKDVAPHAVGDDPDYRAGGADTLVYRVALAALEKPAFVEATLYYQATPPYYLQDRFCTGKGADTARLYFTAGNLDLKGSDAENWKLKVSSTGPIALP
jgi:hypothetical protein